MRRAASSQSRRNSILWCVIVLGIAVPVAGACQAPTTFDEDTVRRLIRTVEQGHNATTLKIAYFGRRTTHPFPTTEGFELLKEALVKEPAGSRRWFALQMVRGFAGFRIGAD